MSLSHELESSVTFEADPAYTIPVWLSLSGDMREMRRSHLVENNSLIDEVEEDIYPQILRQNTPQLDPYKEHTCSIGTLVGNAQGYDCDLLAHTSAMCGASDDS